MGDMADWVDQDDPNYPNGPGEPGPAQCRYCLRTGFTWANTDKGWRLVTPTGLLHKCQAFLQPKVDPRGVFEDVSGEGKKRSDLFKLIPADESAYENPTWTRFAELLAAHAAERPRDMQDMIDLVLEEFLGE